MKYLYVILLFIITVSCSKRIKPTSVEAEDPIRHYYAIPQGEDLFLDYRIMNTGKNPFVITDIQASCGCISIGSNNNLILPGKEGVLRFRYQSSKNIGQVNHSIRVFGNINPKGVLLLEFDVNVVPHADYTRDYEDLFYEYVVKNSTVEELVNGKKSERGYFVDPM